MSVEALNGISVAVRLRPMVFHEKGQIPCLEVRHPNVTVIPSAVPGADVKEPAWSFDHALDSSDPSSPDFVSNARCYELTCHDMVEHALHGFNCCLFCYGQTGTGKTTTILGDKESGPGLLISLFSELFQKIREEEELGCDVQLQVQMLEVYNEKVFDLLAARHRSASDTQRTVELHVLPGGVQVKGVETEIVNSVEECLKLIDRGSQMKHVAATAMNPQSSRGHTIFKLAIQKHDLDHGVHLASEIYFADLAGHENVKTTQVTGDRLVELSFINKSLMCLQSAIHGLSKGHDSKKAEVPVIARPKLQRRKTEGAILNAPASINSLRRMSTGMSDFRNSKLTLLLSNALTGNSLINVIVTLSPAAAHFPTSLSSLRFANEVKHIKVEAHSSAQTDPATRIKHLEKEVADLRAQLAIATADQAPTLCPRCSGQPLKPLMPHHRPQPPLRKHPAHGHASSLLDDLRAAIQAHDDFHGHPSPRERRAG